ncbi:hypothetical protein BS50DRAFT_569179 [Corynespora cassiicola Philippines]|uniref:Uncharacterized protein n=1 Tax=Corynespora cassiicola Philippines TaxID=1448308 RepID=A0A2T2P7N3_CORCC|nr:hypothetical protein BS50DRAFT_569179 [Corynespora cassiicola Philippines]
MPSPTNPITFLILLLVNITTMTYATKTTTLEPFNLSSPAGTDIWRKPPSHNAFSAPTHPSPLPQFALQSFQRARLSFTLPPVSQLRQYDQAGLLLHLTKPGQPEGQDKWVKTGIEFYNNISYISTVGCDSWADWSVVPVPGSGSGEERPGVELEARREKDVLGKSLWIYEIVRDGEGKEVERRPLREVTWFFAEEEGWEVGVGGYVARPNTDNGDGLLEAEFGKGVEIEVLDADKKS